MVIVVGSAIAGGITTRASSLTVQLNNMIDVTINTRRRIEFYKETNENWYPSFEGKYGIKLLRVSHMQLSDGLYRVCVWGADDFGMEIDLADQAEAWGFVEKILSMELIHQSNLRAIGFVTA